MKLVTFTLTTALGRFSRLGACLDDHGAQLLDLNSAYFALLSHEGREPRPTDAANFAMPSDMLQWLQGGDTARLAAEQALEYGRSLLTGGTADPRASNGARLVFAGDEIRLEAPLPRPHSFRAFSAYEGHMAKPGAGTVRNTRSPDWYRYPVYYKGNADTIAGPEDPIPWPSYTERLDPEFEIAIIVGKQGINLSVEEAASHIAGYTILVDSSGRDFRAREFLGPSKDKDFHTALGPCIVTADEMELAGHDVKVSVDGELWWAGNSGDGLGWSAAQLVAYTSDHETIYPGDLISTGTIGASCSLDTGRWVARGQTMTFAVEGIGEMSLPIVAVEGGPGHVRHGMTSLLDPPE